MSREIFERFFITFYGHFSEIKFPASGGVGQFVTDACGEDGKLWERILILNHENHEVGCGCEVRWNALKAMFALTCNVSVCAVFDGFFCNFIKIMVFFGFG